MNPGETQVLDYGFVRLDACEATDLSVVNSARVSFGIRHDEMEEGDDKLINYLMKYHHGTPFEHNMFRFHVKAPIFIFREWQRHRIGSFNELSARYKELEPHWYVPAFKDVRRRVGKPGNYSYEQADERAATGFVIQLEEYCKMNYEFYRRMLEFGIALEQARLVLPVAMYSEMYWTVNARSLMNFLSLRTAETAQWEIQQYAKVVELYFKDKMPFTYYCFSENGRVAP